MTHSTLEFEELYKQVRKIAQEVASIYAPDVDSKARFPIETITALQKVQALSAPVPKEYGGAGCNMRQLGQICAALSAACGSSGMVLAMHYIQVACIARHHQNQQFFLSYLKEIVEKQHVLASITSEVGTSGDTRSSICALERENGRFILNKAATTGSYCAHSDAILVTCRRNNQASNNDQLMVLVQKSDFALTQTTTWDTLGMRGTCSPGFNLESQGLENQVLPVDFADIASETMVPYSHILWASLWWGIANDAVQKAAAYVRILARKTPGNVPPIANRLAEVSVQLQSMKHNWQMLATEFDEINAQPDTVSQLHDMRWALKMNNLKIGASDQAPQIVHKTLQIVGIQGYKNDGTYSLGRHYRDVLSASLMISNERVAGKSATLLLVSKDDN